MWLQDLSNETILRLDAENRAQTLAEELEFLKSVHEQVSHPRCRRRRRRCYHMMMTVMIVVVVVVLMIVVIERNCGSCLDDSGGRGIDDRDGCVGGGDSA